MTAEHKTPNDSGKIPLPWRMYLVLIILGLGTIVAISYGFRKGLTIASRQAPQLDAVMEIMLESTTARLLLEEMIEENRFEKIDSIWLHLERVDWYAQALLAGGSNKKRTYLPLTDVHRRAQIREIQKLCDVLQKLTEQRLAAAKGNSRKSEVKHEYEKTFIQIISLADDVETQLQAVLSNDLRRFRHTQWGLLVSCFLLWLSIGLILHRYERRRSLLLQADKVANESLHAEISLREEAEKVLRESEERFRSLVETTPDWIWETDRNNEYTYVSPKIKDLLGYNPDEVIGKTPLDLMPADEIQRVGKIFEDITRAREPIVSLENTALHKDGRRIVIETSGVPILDADGKLLGYRGIDRDMTERKRSEEERLSHLHFLESVEKVDAAFRGGTDLEKVLEDVMDTVLSIFNCDRAWLLYPCDPTIRTFNVPIERTRPEYPGAYTVGKNIPATKYDAEYCRQALESDDPLIISEGKNLSLVPGVAHEFGVRSLIMMSVNPKIGKPWLFGLHQCSYTREWTTADQQLFKEIGHRVADNLGILLLLRNLRESKATMAEAQRIAHFGTWDWDVKTGEVQWSDEVFRIIDLPKSFHSHIDKIMELSPPEDRDMHLKLIEQATINHDVETFEHRFITPDGIIKNCFSSFQGHYDKNGGLVRIVGVVQDITERKRAEEQLKEAWALFAASFEACPTGILIADAPDARIRMANSAALGIRGETHDMLTDIPVQYHPRNWNTFYPDGTSIEPEDLPLSRAILKGETLSNIEVIIRRETGEDRLVLANAAPVRNADGKIIAGVVMFTDVTEHRQAELALQKTQADLIARQKHEKELVKAELVKAQKELVNSTRLATLGQLTATVSHELRNPLGSIRTAVFTVAEKIRGQMPLLDRALDRAERNIIRCDLIIEELLDYSRAKKPDLQHTRIDSWLGQVLGEQEIPEHIELVRNFNAGIEINIDREQLRRCIINLLTNACQAMEKTPATQARLTIETLVEKDRLLINVHDTGHGISSDKMDKIFEPLYTTKGFGIGLGLAVVEQIIKQLGGGITIESEIDRGTIASLWLPLTPKNNP